MLQYQREHPIRILARISHFAILLVIPILRALLFSGGNLLYWLSGAWIDLLVLFFMVFFGWLAWYFDLYAFTADGVYQYTGVFTIKKTRYPLEKTTEMVVERIWYYRMFGAARLRLDTPGGNSRKNDLSIVVRQKDAEAFLQKAERAYSNVRQVEGDLLSEVGLSLLSSNGFTGAIFLGTLLMQAGNIFGAEFEEQVMDHVTKTAGLVAFFLPPTAALISLMILAGWTISFILNLFRYARFFASRSGPNLQIQTGLFINRRTYVIAADRVNFLEVRQTLITKLLGIFSVNLHVIGYGKARDELPVLIPAFRANNAMRSLAALFPDLPFGARRVRPQRRNFRRFLTIPLWLMGGILLASLLGILLLPAFTGLVVFFGGMFCLADGVYLLTKALSFSHTGACYQDGVYTFRYTRGLNFCRISFSEDQLVKARIRQTVFQKRAGCCTVLVYTYGERATRHLIPNLELAEAKALLGWDTKEV